MSTEVQPADSTRLLKAATCNSLAGTTRLTYELGVQGEADLAIRLASSSGGGLFCKDWVPLAQVLDLLRSMPAEGRITAKLMQALYPGKSVNSGGFLLAALLSEGAVRATEDKRYELGDLDAWMVQLKTRRDSPVESDAAEPVTEKAIRNTKRVSSTKPSKKGPSDANS